MKMAIYRENAVYTKYLGALLAARPDFEVVTFAEGTSDFDIALALPKIQDKVYVAEKVFLDRTCYQIVGDVWKSVSTNYGGLDYDFQEAANKALSKATVEETIVEIVHRMLTKEVPDKILLIQDHMADHNLFGLGVTSDDWKEEALRDAEKLRNCLSEVSGQPVYFLSFGRNDICVDVKIAEEDNVWVISDRHFKNSNRSKWERIPKNFKQFRVPVENLIEDALAFGIDIDAKALSKAIEEKVASW